MCGKEGEPRPKCVFSWADAALRGEFGLDGTESQEDAPAWVQAMFIDNEDSVQEPCVEVEAPSTVVEEEDDTDDSTMVIEESDNWFISMMCGLLGIMCGDSWACMNKIAKNT